MVTARSWIILCRIVKLAVVAFVVGLQLHMVFGRVQKPNKPVNLVSGLLAESPDSLEDLLGGRWR